MMSTKPLNEIFAEKRREKNISVDKIFEEAHIPPKFIYMIEKGQWDKFPSAVQLNGYLRIYAEYLGISSSLIEDNRPGKQLTCNNPEETPCNKDKEHSPVMSRPERRQMFLAACLILALIVLYLLIIYLLPAK